MLFICSGGGQQKFLGGAEEWQKCLEGFSLELTTEQVLLLCTQIVNSNVKNLSLITRHLMFITTAYSGTGNSNCA